MSGVEHQLAASVGLDVPFPFQVRRVGSSAILVEVRDARKVRRLSQWADGRADRHQLDEVIPGARTLYIAASSDRLKQIRRELQELRLPDIDDSRPTRVVVVDVRYDGLDLDEVADRTGLTRSEVVERHSAIEYPVEFFGFAPGQAFMAGLPESLRLPRRSTPRLHVPAGAVAVANEFTVIYPQDSPGGWNLIGTRVSAPLWDSAATPPNRVEVGDRVRLRPC